MPLKNGRDSKGLFWQWGSKKKYYYKAYDSLGRLRAKKKAILQAVAITYSKQKF